MKSKPYVVLVGMDFSSLADRALAHAFELATRHDRAEVHVLCVIPSAGLGTHHALTGYSLTAEAGVRDGAFESLRAHVQAELDTFVARTAPPLRVPEQVVSHVRLDVPALGIVELASTLSADLIVLGTHGHRGSRHSLMGSVAENTVRYAACPVLVVPDAKWARETSERSAAAQPWSSLSVPPRSAAHHPSVRP
ncbi:MAG TPA: universal stress protein [Polyangiaceae bacterium]|nr:universal stress protein [Polyangiaceae bacterium]